MAKKKSPKKTRKTRPLQIAIPDLTRRRHPDLHPQERMIWKALHDVMPPDAGPQSVQNRVRAIEILITYLIWTAWDVFHKRK